MSACMRTCLWAMHVVSRSTVLYTEERVDELELELELPIEPVAAGSIGSRTPFECLPLLFGRQRPVCNEWLARTAGKHIEYRSGESMRRRYTATIIALWELQTLPCGPSTPGTTFHPTLCPCWCSWRHRIRMAPK